jgi:hypothetical protein
MPARNPPNPNAEALTERFQEMARKLGSDEDAFKAKLDQIARHKTRR